MPRRSSTEKQEHDKKKTRIKDVAKDDATSSSSASSWRSILKRSLAPNSKPTEITFPELPTVLYWFRAAMGALVGVYIGITGNHNDSSSDGSHSGTAKLLQSFNLVCFVPAMYVYLFLGVQQHFGGLGKIMLTGTVPAMALCVLIWISCFTAAHEREVQLLNAMLKVVETVNATAAADVNATLIDNES
jgi:hypothetical protein